MYRFSVYQDCRDTRARRRADDSRYRAPAGLRIDSVQSVRTVGVTELERCVNSVTGFAGVQVFRRDSVQPACTDVRPFFGTSPFSVVICVNGMNSCSGMKTSLSENAGTSRADAVANECCAGCAAHTLGAHARAQTHDPLRHAASRLDGQPDHQGNG